MNALGTCYGSTALNTLSGPAFHRKSAGGNGTGMLQSETRRLSIGEYFIQGGTSGSVTKHCSVYWVHLGAIWARERRKLFPKLKVASRDGQNQVDGAQKPKSHGQTWEEG